MRAFAATALGLLAGLAGAAIWYAVRKITDYEIGLIAIVVGLMVGVAVRKGSKGRGGWFYQALAMTLTYCCVCASTCRISSRAWCRNLAGITQRQRPPRCCGR